MEISLKTKSWHYRLATAYGSLSTYAETTDICDYTRQVLKGVFIAVFMTAIISVAALCVIDMLMGIGFSIAYGVMLMNPPGLIALILIIALGIIFSIAFAADKMNETVRNTQPGFVRTAYRSWKDKFCVKVKLV